MEQSKEFNRSVVVMPNMAFHSGKLKHKEVERMKDKTTHLYVDSHEKTLILHSLVELKNALIRQGRYTDCIDELIFKVANAPVKKMKIEYV